MTDDEETISAVASCCHIVTKKKGDILYGPGATEGSTIVLLDGVLRTYILSPDGTENTLTFWFKPGTFICVTKEMINIPAYWCVAATDCTLIEMVGTTVYDLAEEYPLLWKEIMFGTLPFAVRIMDKARAGYTLPDTSLCGPHHGQSSCRIHSACKRALPLVPGELRTR